MKVLGLDRNIALGFASYAISVPRPLFLCYISCIAPVAVLYLLHIYACMQHESNALLAS